MVYELATAQAALGHDVVIATLANDGVPRDIVEGRLTIRQFVAAPGLYRRFSFKPGSTLRREGVRFDVVHTHNTFSPLNLTALRLARRWSAPLFAHSHGALDPALMAGRSLKELRKKAYARLVETRVLTSASTVFALSDQEASWLRQLSAKATIAVIPNGIAPIGAASDAEEAAFRRRVGLVGTPVLLYVGRAVPKKNLALIFQAVARLRVEFPSLILLICTERVENDPYIAKLDSLAHDLQLGGAIRWAGFVDESEKRCAYRSSSVFLHASLSEGMPMAVLEAMAAGLPCVVTPGTMMAEAAAAGAVLERDGLEDYAGAIAGLLNDETWALSLGSRAQELTEQRYSWGRIATDLCEIYADRSSIQR